MHTRLRIAAVTLLFGAAANPAQAQILPAGAVPTKLTPASVGGIAIAFTEGALWDGTGGVYFSDMHPSGTPVTNPSRILHYDIASGMTTVADALSGGTNGMYRAGGFIYTADRDGGKAGQTRQISRRLTSDISMIDADLVTGFNSKPLNGPNDLVVDSNGGIYFTDPNYENRVGAQGVDGLYYRNPAGNVSLLKSYTGTTHRPNGVILSPDGKTLYLALQASSERRVLAYDVAPDGSISSERQFASMAPNGDPDGITIDPAGDVYAAGNKDIWAWNPAGTKLFQLSMPGTGSAQEDPTNLDFGGADGKTLFITAGISLYSVHLNIATPATGDYNGNGVVDAADYVVWRDTVGSTTNFAADGTGDHVIDQADYDWWVGKFAAAGSASGSTGRQNAIPEPGTFALAAIALLSLLCLRLRPTKLLNTCKQSKRSSFHSVRSVISCSI
jgi:gluconolactonase